MVWHQLDFSNILLENVPKLKSLTTKYPAGYYGKKKTHAPSSHANLASEGSGAAVITAICIPFKGTGSAKLLKYLTRLVKLTFIYDGHRTGLFHQPILTGQWFLPWVRALCLLGWSSGFPAHWWSAFHLCRHVRCTACNISLGLFSQLCQLAALPEPRGAGI